MGKKNTEVKDAPKDAPKDAKKVEAAENLSNAAVFQILGKQGAKSRADLAEKMLAYLAGKGKTVNNKGKQIDLTHLKQQISAMVRDIKIKTGDSWHTKLNVEETDTTFKLVAK